MSKNNHSAKTKACLQSLKISIKKKLRKIERNLEIERFLHDRKEWEKYKMRNIIRTEEEIERKGFLILIR
jgi:hypothetical protein